MPNNSHAYTSAHWHQSILPYWLQEIIAGVAAVESSGEVRHEGLSLTLEGVVNLQLSTKNVGIFEAFSNSIKVFLLLFGLIVKVVHNDENVIFSA